ncbi:ABC transporter permease [Marinomonas sp. 42_23_T18]|nr:ABC transporter permease [Marinomonas sp. 42_23_T18]
MKLALKILLRELRNGDILTLALAMVLSVATVTGISLFIDRLQSSFELQSATLLAADRVVRSPNELPMEWQLKAQSSGLSVANRAWFSTMVFTEAGLQLSQVSAVTEAYPLRGEYLIDKALFGVGYATPNSPAQGEVWVSSRLASLLEVDIGDDIQIGEADFSVTAYLVRDPGSSASAFAIAPRAVINWKDLDKTQVIQPGSRVRYALLMAGNSELLDDMEQWVKPKLNDNQEWRSPRAGGRGIGATIDRAESFLLLAGTLAVVMAGVAMALASNRYVKRHLAQVAVMKTLGATPKKIASILIWQLACIFVFGSLLGLMLGWSVQAFIAYSLETLLSTALPEPGLDKIWLGIITGLTSLIAFCLPLMVRLLGVSPLSVLQPMGRIEGKTALLYAFGFIGMYSLMVIYTQGFLLPSLMVLSVLLVSVLVASIGFVLFKLGRKFTAGATSGWQIGLAALHRRLQSNLFQLLVFTLIIMLVLILTGVRSNLISDWQSQLPKGAANHYLFNIQQDDVAPLQTMMSGLEIEASDWYPMVLGRVTKINQKEVNALFEDRKERPEMLSRELNLTWTDHLGVDNEIIEGVFDPMQDGFSIEFSAAQEAQITLGDEITLFIGGREYSQIVTSIRRVDWSSMRPNFYLILPQTILSDFPANYITSVYVADQNKQGFYKGMADYPTVSLLNVGDLIGQIQLIIAQVSQAIQLLLGFIVASGALVLVASIRASLDERLEEGALLRTLGASKSLIRQAMLIEFGFLGLFAGAIAALAAEACLYGLQVYLFELSASFHPMLWIIGPVLGFVIVTGIGLFAGRSVLKVAPMRMLQAL